MRALYVAATGAKLQSKAVDNIANNIANSNTTSFKKGMLAATDLLYQTEKRVGGPVSADSDVIVPTGVQFGSGAAVTAIVKDYRQGDPINTGEDLNLTINGKGFFIVNMPDGTQAYTRDGTFHIDPTTNQLVTSLGYVISPGIEIPNNYKKIMIKQDGTVLVTLPDDDIPQIQGQLDMATFINVEGLEAMGDNLLLQTDASGDVILGNAGVDNFGVIMQGWLEGSNVDPITELSDLIKAQRTYEMNVKTIQVADQMEKTTTDAKA